MQGKSNPVTPAGYAAMRARYDHLLGTERPAIVEIVSWAAGNGDRSENGDYLYGRKRMREIDRELAHLARRMKAARVIDPAAQPDKSRAFFGATITLSDLTCFSVILCATVLYGNLAKDYRPVEGARQLPMSDLVRFAPAARLRVAESRGAVLGAARGRGRALVAAAAATALVAAAPARPRRS